MGRRSPEPQNQYVVGDAVDYMQSASKDATVRATVVAVDDAYHVTVSWPSIMKSRPNHVDTWVSVRRVAPAGTVLPL